MPPMTGVILAGGQGRRMGSVDKGLQLLRGRPMIAWVIERLAPQVGQILISANQNLEDYMAFGYPVVPDVTGGFAGPLAGLQAGMQQAAHELVLTVPCDSPFVPQDLGQRLHAALSGQDADIAVAKTGGRRHPVFTLCRRDLLAHLTRFLAQGDRKVYLWHDSLKVAEAAFDDEADAFSNINTRDELRAFESP